jgi:hypothetical protein
MILFFCWSIMLHDIQECMMPFWSEAPMFAVFILDFVGTSQSFVS